MMVVAMAMVMARAHRCWRILDNIHDNASALHSQSKPAPSPPPPPPTAHSPTHQLLCTHLSCQLSVCGDTCRRRLPEKHSCDVAGSGGGVGDRRVSVR